VRSIAGAAWLRRSVRGIDGLKLATSGFHAGFPGRRVFVEDLILADDKVAVRVTQEGAHQGAFQGIAPTGKQISVTATAFFRI
jgi:predicted ester cyclase